jgi:hypothetical protein
LDEATRQTTLILGVVILTFVITVVWLRIKARKNK